MAKPSATIDTPRPSTLRSSSSSCSATRSSVGSTSSSSSTATAAAAAESKLPVAFATHRDSASISKVVVAKCLVYDDDYFTLSSSAAAAPAPHSEDGIASQEDDMAPLLELPDPDDTSSTSVVSAAADDALTASADSCVTEVAARTDSTTDTDTDTEADDAAALPVPEEISRALAELRGASGLSPRSKRLLAALAEAAALELAPAAPTTSSSTARRTPPPRRLLGQGARGGAGGDARRRRRARRLPLRAPRQRAVRPRPAAPHLMVCVVGLMVVTLPSAAACLLLFLAAIASRSTLHTYT